MDVCLDILRALKINDCFNILDVDSPGCYFGSYQNLSITLESIHDCRSLVLVFVTMDDQDRDLYKILYHSTQLF